MLSFSVQFNNERGAGDNAGGNQQLVGLWPYCLCCQNSWLVLKWRTYTVIMWETYIQQ